MYECVILYRINKGPYIEIVRDIEDGTDEIALFPNIDVAVDYCNNNKLFNSGQADYQIVELDEL